MAVGKGRRSVRWVTAAVVAAIAVVVVLAVAGGGRRTAQVPAVDAASFQPLVAYAGPSGVALHDGPSLGSPSTVVPGHSSLGVPTVFLVKQRQGAWIQVYVPRRPDGSTAWVAASTVTLRPNPYEVHVQESAHRVTVTDAGRVIVTTPAAVGAPATPTPVGTFFITELLRQPDPQGAYGPFAYGLSAFSNVLYHFAGGPGQIGFHGTNEPASIGRSSSHGCVRIPNAVVDQLVQVLPIGTPVVIQP